MLRKNIRDNEQADGEEQIAADRSEDLGEIVLASRTKWCRENYGDMKTGTWTWRACSLTCAKKAFSQYSWSVRTRAIRSGATVLITDAINSIHRTGMRCTKMPVAILVSVPAMRDGTTCSDALRAEVPWTC